jgi:prephenate dehydratase
VTVGFQGEPGAFSDAAARALRSNAQTIGFSSFDMLVAAVDRGVVTEALLPIENAIAGPVARAWDLLWDHPRLHIIAETVISVRMDLIGTPNATEAMVREIRSHPVALEQIHHYTTERPALRRIAVADTAGAVADIMRVGDPTVAAVGSELAAELYGAKILRRGIQDDERNATRFFLLSQKPSETDGPHACVGIEVPNVAGSLYRALGAFAARHIDLRAIVPRPNHIDPFHYRFIFELYGVNASVIRETLAAIDGTTRIFGIYG